MYSKTPEDIINPISGYVLVRLGLVNADNCIRGNYIYNFLSFAFGNYTWFLLFLWARLQAPLPQ